MMRYYSRHFGIVVLQIIENKDTNNVSYHSYIMTKCGQIVDGSQRTVEELHSKFINENESRKHRHQLVHAIEQMVIHLGSSQKRATKVRFSSIIHEFDVARKEKFTKHQAHAEWDECGRQNRLNGLCEEDYVKDILEDELDIFFCRR